MSYSHPGQDVRRLNPYRTGDRGEVGPDQVLGPHLCSPASQPVGVSELLSFSEPQLLPQECRLGFPTPKGFPEGLVSLCVCVCVCVHMRVCARASVLSAVICILRSPLPSWRGGTQYPREAERPGLSCFLLYPQTKDSAWHIVGPQ